jgi:hypothetical protein
MIETKVHVLPLGRFKFIAEGDEGFSVGDFVVLERSDGAWLGQVTDAKLEYSVGETEVIRFSMGREPPARRVGSYGVVSGEGTVLGGFTEQGIKLGHGGTQAEGRYSWLRPVVCH